ncbi:type II toxin-antitoxin system HipA family toxin YjjJ [Paucibacter sp. R3-3]|uniref:Type II toxin-antitoxin system HipA family toxin YjjJ n=1 Tax=Roseateles agri TaxID=3098619 RepID=A0ABU5DJ43_9BURK|nr:type II toxin-antitoxin system HipA family toxin YjjJ [Paucibacter sp. R3-3]MDY0746305.1 type II toxin-antitoxin system HipA family toxin YjjJ [Paucibacter sp. R3-3]
MADAVDELLGLLRQRHLLAAQALRDALRISPPTLMRAVRQAGEQVLTIGRARRTAYTLRRPLRGSLAPLPLYSIGTDGRAETVAQLHLGHPDGTLVEVANADRFEWPLAQAGTRMRDGWFEGLPYFLQDMRPQGFLGRRFARDHAALLQLAENPQDWSDDDALYALSLLGSDQSGNFIIGDAAFHHWQAQAEVPITAGDELRSYAELAQLAMAFGPAGSSVAGEFPKFTALRDDEGTPRHVLVKFSGSDDSPGTQRWSDLLVCEQLASTLVGTLPGLQGTASRILRGEGRTFFEVGRFDRHGLLGRSGLCSWAAINADWFGLAGRSWADGAAALAAAGLIDAQAQAAVQRLAFFGQLIANTDMHDGNLSFEPGPAASLRLAPVYDMLPMAYRPQAGVELPVVDFTPRLPLPPQREAWVLAAEAAQRFWAQAADDARISAGFRAICADNQQRVAAAYRRV